ncbi:MAG: N-acyl-D-glucosamine 2-epimerase [Balneolaceae bacterium]|nr:MAG: N-acyl-D-glucosamine 2-epimerase [Balneolaceae bacterium]
MIPHEMLAELSQRMGHELDKRILPFWSEKAVDEDHGGFIGRITNDGHRVPEAPRSAVLNTRILWTFSSSYRAKETPRLLELAHRAYEYIVAHFLDKKHGGIYWMVNFDGSVADPKKHTYATAFAIYAISEYYRATGLQKAMDEAVALYQLLDQYGYDPATGAYYEAFERSWTKTDDVRLSDSDQPERFSMNTQLHLLEAFTNLLRIYPDATLRKRLLGLMYLFTDKIYNHDNHHFHSFFDDEWNPVPLPYSYGHGIETVWLMADAARLLGDDALNARIGEITRDVAANVITEGYDPVQGGIYNSGYNGTVKDSDKHWWAQAEAIVGFLEAYSITGDPAYISKAFQTWEFIQNRLINKDVGEWYFRVDSGGKPCTGEDILGPWKCPYHSARACLLVPERAQQIMSSGRVTAEVTK